MSAHAAMRLNNIHEEEKAQKEAVEKILIKKSKLKWNATLKDAIEELSLEKDISIYETSVKSSINVTGSLNDAVLSTWIKHA